MKRSRTAETAAPQLARGVARLGTESAFAVLAKARELESQDCVTAMVEEFRRRRDVVVAGLKALPGVSRRSRRGAFYVFPDVSGVRIDSERLVARPIEEAGVALLAGEGFGAQGDWHLRISYANSHAQLELALGRIGAFLGEDMLDRREE